MTETNIKNATKNQTKKIRECKFKKFLSLQIFNKILFSLIVFGIFYYLSSINDMTIKGFRLQELKKELNTISSQNIEMNNKVISLKSFNDLAVRAENLEMVAVRKIDYVSAIGGVVVKK